MNDVVISGISGVFPGCDNLRELFEKLSDKIDLTTDNTRKYAGNIKLPSKVGLLDTFNKFDASFFGIPHRAAQSMDPQCRILLEKSFEALMDAGINPRNLRGTKTGVFIGSCYTQSINPFLDVQSHKYVNFATEQLASMLANRLSFWLGVHGPSYVVDSACSSSLYALEQGYKSIKDGICDFALVGAANGPVDLAATIMFSRLGVLSKDGRCKCFDESADGYCRAEAVGVVFLQRAKNARRIYARIINAKTNSDGFKEEGIDHPNGLVHQRLLQELYQECNVDPKTVDFVEAHATGTTVGDLEEAGAIDAVFCRNRDNPLNVGSVKSNMGHSEGASGMCSLAKIVLMMENGVILPNIHLNKLRTDVEAFEKGRITVPTETLHRIVRLAGVNNLGYGGSNAHVLLRSNEKHKTRDSLPSDDLPRLVCVSGRTEEAVESILKELEHNPLDREFVGMLHQIHEDEIIGHVFRGYVLMKKNLNKVAKNIEYFSGTKRPLWFVYAGMGSQWTTMGETLLNIPVFARSIDKCRRILQEKGVDLMRIITDDDRTIFDNILNSFVGITAIQIALTDVLNELGILPDGIVGHSLGEIGCAYADGCLTLEQAVLASYYRGLSSVETTELIHGSMAAVGLGYGAMKDKVPADIDVACHNGPDSCTLSGPTKSIIEYVKRLKSQDIFVRAVNVANIAYHSRYIAPAAPKMLNYLKQVVVVPKQRSDNWISSSVLESEWHTDEAKFASAVYLTNNLLRPVYFEEACRKIPANAVVVEIGPHSMMQSILKRSLPNDVINVPLTLKRVDNTDFLLTAVGKIYTSGNEMKLHKLYPAVEYPVSKGTPMIAPLIKWDHEENFESIGSNQTRTGVRTVRVSLEDPEWEFISGHVIDGKILFPATGYLKLVWETIAIMNSELYSILPIVFEDVRFIRATKITKDRVVHFIVTVEGGTGNFEIVEDGTAIVTGRAYVPEDANKEMNNEPDSSVSIRDNDPDNLPLTSEDVYKELRLSGYHYKGIFKGVTKADSSGEIAYVRWFDNFVAYVDSMLHTGILKGGIRTLLVPTGIKKVIINTDKHRNILSAFPEEKNPEIPVYSYAHLGLIRSGGVEVTKLKVNSIATRKPTVNPVLERCQFVPFQTDIVPSAIFTVDDVVRVSINLILENLQMNNNHIFKSVELLADVVMPSEDNSKKNHPLISPLVSRVFSDLPLIQLKSIIFGDVEKHQLAEQMENDISIESRNKFSADCEASLAIATNVLSSGKDLVALDAVIDGGFVLSREPLDREIRPEEYGLSMCLDYTLENERVLLLRKQATLSRVEPIVIKISANNYSWVLKVQNAIDQLNREQSQKLIIYSEREPRNGIVGFFKALKKEPYSDNVRCFFITDNDAPPFDLRHPLYKLQATKDLTLNIYKNGAWGTYVYFPLDVRQTVQTAHVYANTLIPGNLSSLKWIQGPIDPNDSSSAGTDDVLYVQYASLNFRDIAIASGRISAYDLASDRLDQECMIGFEFTGRIANGKRYMGLFKTRGMSSLVKLSHEKIEIPDHWSWEDAATVTAVYETVVYALITIGNISKGESVLIHCGSGGVGQAAINICLHYDCEIFTTVGTDEKRRFIRETFPQIPENHVGNSRDLSFVNMVMKQTGGKGVDIVLNSLTETKLQASFECLAHGGRFLELGKFDLIQDNMLSMNTFLKNASFHGIDLSTITPKTIEKLLEIIKELIDAGAVKPITRTVFDYCDLEAAFRYMAAGKHIGKVILKLRDERDEFDWTRMYEAVPRYWCDSNKSYVICGGLGGFGLELADWLVLRGARKLILVSRNGIKTGYQSRRVRLWRSYGVNVLISLDDIAKEDGVRHLLDKANSMGPVSAIFNLAMVLRDAIFKNQDEHSFIESACPKAIATELLDQFSRIMCPKLEHFVMFSSVSGGRGNAGQTSYAMANSAMERICESRREDGLPATAIEWGAIGDVGEVAKITKDDVDLVICGTLQQRISSCLQVMDHLLKQPNAVVSSIVIAEKQSNLVRSANLIDTIANALGLKKLASISLNSTLAELGMDSMLAVEIKQTLERDFEIFMTLEEIRYLTFSKLKEISDDREKKRSTVEKTAVTDDPDEKVRETIMNLVFNKIPDVAEASLPIVRIPRDRSPMENSVNGLQAIFLLPGLDGNSLMMESLVANLGVEAFCLQYSFEDPKNSVKELASAVYPHIRDRLPSGKSFFLIGYSYGAILALELIRLLEADGYTDGNLCLIDSSPQYTKRLLETGVSLNNPQRKQEFQIKFISHCADLVWPGISAELTNRLHRCDNWSDCLNLISSIVPDEGIDHPKNYQTMFINACYVRLKHLLAEDNEEINVAPLLRTRATLIRIRDTLVPCADDYDLSQYFESAVKVHYVDAVHSTILEKKHTWNIIKSLF